MVGVKEGVGKRHFVDEIIVCEDTISIVGNGVDTRVLRGDWFSFQVSSLLVHETETLSHVPPGGISSPANQK